MYDLIVTLSTEICDLCSACDFSVVCAGLLVSYSVQASIMYKNIVDICMKSSILDKQFPRYGGGFKK